MPFPLAMFGLFVGMSIAKYLLQDDEDDEGNESDSMRRGSTRMAKEGDALPVVFGRCRVNGLPIVLHDSVGPLSDYFDNAHWFPLGTEESAKKEYYLSAQFAVCQVPTAAVVKKFTKLWVSGKFVTDFEFPAFQAGAIFLDLPDFFGGKKRGGGLGIGNASSRFGTNARGLYRPYWGDDTQTEAPQVVAMVEDSTEQFASGWNFHAGGLPGVAHFIVGEFSIGETSNIPAFSVEMVVNPTVPGVLSTVGGVDDVDANPAAVLYHILTADDTGAGINTGKINTTSFNDAATTLSAEGNGFSMVISKKTKLSSLIRTLLRQMDAVLWWDVTDQSVHLKLIRDDYGSHPFAALDSYDDSDVDEILDFQRTTWDETHNQVSIKFYDRANSYATKYAVSQDISNVRKSGRQRAKEIFFPGVKTAALATTLAGRELKNLAIPVVAVNLVVSRRAYNLKPGDVFKWSCPEYGITNMVLRVSSTDHGTLEDNRITLSCIQDRFANVATAFAPPLPPWSVPRTLPGIPRFADVLELPPALSQVPGTGEGATTPNTNDNALATLVGQPNAATTTAQVEVSTDGGATYLQSSLSMKLCPVATIDTTYSASLGPYKDTVTGLIVKDVTDVSLLKSATEAEIREGANLLYSGGEYLAYEGFTDLTGGRYELKPVWRGLFDTTATELKAERGIYFISEVDFTSVKSNVRITRQKNVLVRIAADAQGGVQSPREAMVVDIDVQRRGQRPIAPEGFTLYVQGYNAISTPYEVEYAYDLQDALAVVQIAAVGTDDIASSTDVGTVFTNDLRSTFNRRPSQPTSMVLGSDTDQAPNPGEGVYYKFEGKLDTATEWSVIYDTPYGNSLTGKIIEAWDWPSMALMGNGPGEIRLCAYRNAPDTGEEVCSLQYESIAIDMISCRQLLINRKLRSMWDTQVPSVDVGSGRDQVVGRSAVSMRGWTLVDTVIGNDKSGLLLSPLEQGITVRGTGLYGGDATWEQIIPVPYVDTEGSELLLRGKIVDASGTGDAVQIILEGLDTSMQQVTGYINNWAVSSNTDWISESTPNTGMPADVAFIRLTLDRALPGAGNMSNLELHMSPEISSQLLFNNEFVVATFGWTLTAGTWTAAATASALTRLTVGTAASQILISPTIATGIIEQTIALPTLASAKDWARLSFWAANLNSDTDTFTVTLGASDAGAAVITSSVFGPYTHSDSTDEWNNHEVWLEIPEECTDLNVKIQTDIGSGTLTEVVFSELDLRVHKHAPRPTLLNYREASVQPRPATPKAFEVACDTPEVVPSHIFLFDEGVAGSPTDAVRGTVLDETTGTVDVDYSNGASAYGINNGTDVKSLYAMELSKQGGGVACSDLNFLNPNNNSFGIYFHFRLLGDNHASGSNMVMKIQDRFDSEAAINTAGFQVWYNPVNQRIYFDCEVDNEGGTYGSASTRVFGLPEDGAWHWLYVKYDVDAETISSYTDYDAGETDSITDFLSQDFSNVTDKVYFGKNPDLIASASAYADGFSSPMQISYMATFRGRAAEKFTRTAGQNMWLHATDPNANALTYTRANTATFPIGNSEVATYSGSGGGGPVQAPQMWVDGFTDDVNKLGLPSFPAIQNLIPYANDMSNAAWTKTNATVVVDKEVSPRGGREMATITQTALGGWAEVTVTGLTSLTKYTLSCYAETFSSEAATHIEVTQDNLSTLHATLNMDTTNPLQRFSMEFTTHVTQSQLKVRVYGATPATSAATAGVWGLMLQKGVELGPIVLNDDATLNLSSAMSQSLTTTTNKLVSADEGAIQALYACVSATSALTRNVALCAGTGLADSREFTYTPLGVGAIDVWTGTGTYATGITGLPSVVAGVEVDNITRWRPKVALPQGGTLHSLIGGTTSTSATTWTPGPGITRHFIGCDDASAGQLSGVIRQVKLFIGNPRDPSL